MSSLLTLLLVPVFFQGFADGSLHLSDPLTMGQLHTVLPRVWQYYQPSASQSGADLNTWLFGPLLSGPLSDDLTVSETQAEISAYTASEGQKPYFLPLQIGNYEEGSVTRSKADELYRKKLR